MLDTAISIKYMLAGYVSSWCSSRPTPASLVLRRRAPKRKLQDLDELAKK